MMARQRLNLAKDDGMMLSERIYELRGLCRMKVVEQTNSFVVFNVATHIVMLSVHISWEKHD